MLRCVTHSWWSLRQIPATAKLFAYLFIYLIAGNYIKLCLLELPSFFPHLLFKEHGKYPPFKYFHASFIWTSLIKGWRKPDHCRIHFAAEVPTTLHLLWFSPAQGGVGERRTLWGTEAGAKSSCCPSEPQHWHLLPVYTWFQQSLSLLLHVTCISTGCWFCKSNIFG